MGGGGGGPTTLYTSGVSGQGGGRIIPGTSSNLSPWTYVTTVTGSAITAIVDNRYNTTGLTYLFGDSVGAPPSSAGQVGRDGTFVVYSYTSGGNTSQYVPSSGAGGGWGAQGGTSSVAGAAGGKAINTAGNTVTWIGGSSRVHGVVG